MDEVLASEVDRPPSGARIIEHFRLDPSRGLWLALAPASLLVVLGSMLVGGAVVAHRLDADLPPIGLRRSTTFLARVDVEGRPIDEPTGPLWLALAGIVTVGAGGAVAIAGLRRALSEESYLLLRTDGAYFQHGSERELVAWEDVEAVRFDAERRALVLERHDGSIVERRERFAGIEGDELARRAARVRRKALFGLL